jgi:predicted nucleotidyltransferase
VRAWAGTDSGPCDHQLIQAPTAGNTAWHYIRNLSNIIQVVDKSAPPPLLPILRSQQQAELLALLLGDPDLEVSVSALAERAGVPYASVHREVERGESAGLLTSRRVGRTRLVRANTSSPYYVGLADVLTKAFGIPHLLADALDGVAGIEKAFIYGSWASRYQGETGPRPVGDIDVLVLGEPDRDRLFGATSPLEARLGRPVQITIRNAHWLETGSGSFHDAVTSRPLIDVPLRS